MLLNFTSHSAVRTTQSPERPDEPRVVTDKARSAPQQPVSAGPPPRDADTPHLAELQERVAELNRIETLRAHRLEFSIHESTGRMIVRVMDRATDEIVRQFPPDELLDVAEQLDLGEPGSLSDSAA